MAENLFIPQNASREEKYVALWPQLQALVEGETDYVANLSNIAAALHQAFSFFWVGFYIVKNDKLMLGPFQGTIACMEIPYGKGVCGTAWEKRETIIVDDVDSFPGHITCSSLSKSEIVLPLFDKQNNVFAVLDIDSECLNTFDKTDSYYLEEIIKLIQ
jgi:GAF domain-containing protein